MTNILILGLGISGQAVLNFYKKFFKNKNYKINVYDKTILGSEKELELENFKKNQIIFASPGFDINGEILKKAQDLKLKISSDIDLFGELAGLNKNIKIIGITGSNGKSTVTKMVFEMIQACGKKVVMGGNIGTSPLDFLEAQAQEEIFYVLEISSFQMELANNLKPTVGVFLNLSPNHLDRHKTMEIYGGLKQKLLDQSEFKILGFDLVSPLAGRDEKHEIVFGLTHGDFYLSPNNFLKYKDKNLISRSDLANPEAHNILNALAALAVIKTLNLDLEKACEVLKIYKPLPHRTELVCEINSVKYIDDSKATTIGATEAALVGANKNIILLLGGQSKGQDFKDLKQSVDHCVKQVFIFGQDKNLIFEGLGHQGVLLNNLKEAVDQAYLLAQPGDIVLLSPACASLDQFKNYEERGACFKNYVQGLAK